MSSMFALAHERSTLTSSSSIPSSRTTSQVMLPINKHCVTPPRRGVWLFGQSYFFHRLWAQRDRQLRLLRDYWNLPPGAIQRHNADTIGKALSSPLFIQEWEEPAGGRQAYLSSEESLLSSQSLSVGHVRTERPVHELSSPGSSSSREMENETREELPLPKKESRVKGRGTFKKKIDWRLLRSNFILPGLECQDSLQPWWQRREVPRCWDWRRAHQEFAGFTTVPSGARSKCEPVAGSSLTKRKFVSTCTVNFQ